jgi:GAF domain-containing protein
VLSVVDCFDALTSDRPYRRALTDEAAFKILVAQRGKMYDPEVVDTFARMHNERRSHAAAAPAAPNSNARIAQAVVREMPPTVTAIHRRQQTESVSTDTTADRGDLHDVVALIRAVLRSLPDATCALYRATNEGTLVVDYAAGQLAPALRGFSIDVNAALTGWVAAHRQTIINSDAALDLNVLGVMDTRRMCMSTPLVDRDALVGVLTVYTDSPVPIPDDQARALQLIAPHVARLMLRTRGADGMMPATSGRRAASASVLVAV